MHTFKGFHRHPLFILVPLKCHLCFVQKFPGREHRDGAACGGFGLPGGLLSGLANSSLASSAVVTELRLPWRLCVQETTLHPPASGTLILSLESGGGKSVCREKEGGVACGRESIWALHLC